MPEVDNELLVQKNADINENEIFIYATHFDCDVDVKKVAITDSLRTGILYRCAIESHTAYSISVVFDEFTIPDGAKLFLYDSEYKQLLGAFTSNNNKPNKIFAIAPIFAEKIIIEYFEPYFADFLGEVHIGQVHHGFIDISETVNSIYDGTCEVDINCSEGSNWQTEKHAVCRIVFGDTLCSGALINNTKFDGKPYCLTANHCISTEANAAICIFYFNYEHSRCGGGSANSSQTLSGATLRAHNNYSDFSLLELLEIPNVTYSPYWAGWDRNTEHGAGGVGIHHPLGLPKKISTYDIEPKTTSCRYPYSNYYMIDEWKETEYGYGVTEGGSSGSPLFNNKHRIIGQLYGGCGAHNSNCDDPANDYSIYGKFHLSWEYGTNANSRLKEWLDPNNTGYMAIEGLNTCSDDAILDMNIYQTVSTEGVVALYSRDYIESSASLLQGSQVSYVANNYIKLQPGFNVQQGAEFHAMISHTMCNESSPISILDWNNEITGDGVLEFNVVNAESFDVIIRTLSGELILEKWDTIINNHIVLQEPLLKNDTSFLITIVFQNAIERVSNTYLLMNHHKNKKQKEYNIEPEKSTDVESLDIFILPTPDREVLNLKVITNQFTPFSVMIYDLSGNNVASCNYVNATSLRMNVSQLSHGEYIAKVVMGNRHVVKKFMKE